MNETIKLGLVLLLVTAVAGGILAGVNSITAPVIAERENQEKFASLLEIFAEANEFIEFESSDLSSIQTSYPSIVSITEVKNNGVELGYAITTKTGGYAGDITALTGINTDGTIAGMKVLVMTETAGLGSRIVDDPSFAESFEGKGVGGSVTPAGAGASENEVMMLSGATVSTNAVVKGVNEALNAFSNSLAN